MKLNKVALATMVVLGLGVPVVHSQTDASNKNKLVGLSTNAVKKRVAQQQQHASTTVKSASEKFLDARKTNRSVKPTSANRKFVREEGLTGEHAYIVVLEDSPVATYDGSIANYASTHLSSTQNATGGNGILSKSKSNIEAVNRYTNYLHKRQNTLVNSARTQGISLNVKKRFTNAVNGITTVLTQDEAEQLASMPGVRAVQRSRLLQLHTDVGPEHIGAAAAWDGNATDGTALKGEGIIVGIIDTGVNTDHPAFADIGGDGYDHTNPWGAGTYVGDCATEEWASLCNDKLIGVRSYSMITDYYDAEIVQAEQNDDESDNVLIAPKNGEDHQGHGSHVASTAAGNVLFNVPYQGVSADHPDGVDIGHYFARTSGVAPHANIISYQVCFPESSALGGCPTEAILAAVDDAIADGVDVINYSIGADEILPWNDVTQLAFLAAREAGIDVVVAAGNSGDDAISNTSPWQNVVGATHHGREIDVSEKQLGTFSGGDLDAPYEISGAGISEGITAPIVLASNYGDSLCSEAFAEGTFNGEIVVCERGEVARVAKANNVLAGGAGGFVLYNVSSFGDESNTVNDVYPLPGIHIDDWDGSELVTWLSSGTDHVATISGTEISQSMNEELVDAYATFSSTGPSKVYNHSLFPTIAAPGVDIIAAYADDTPFANYPASSDYSLLSGTSMASPHVAGAIALLNQAYPAWTPSEIQSAIQMTSTPVRNRPDDRDWDGEEASYHKAGAGVINVENALKAGFVMHETNQAYIDANPANGGDAKYLNMPQIMDEYCYNTCSWVRTIKATKDASWSVSTSAKENSVGFTVTPSEFSLKAGEEQSVLVTADYVEMQGTDLELGYEVQGTITFTPDNSDVATAHWPVAVEYVRGGLPETINILAHRDDGREIVANMQSDAIQSFTARIYQPVKADIQTVTLPQDLDTEWPLKDGLVSESDHIIWLDVGDNAARLVTEVLLHATTSAEDVNDKGIAKVLVGKDFNGNGEVDPIDEALCASTAEYEANWCNINSPESGKYWVLIHNAVSFASEQYEDTYVVSTAVVDAEIADNMSVSGPASTDGITPYTINVDWDFESIEHGDKYYTALDLGINEENTGNLGMIPVNWERSSDEVSIELSQTSAKAGDVIDVTVNVMSNQTGGTRDFELQTTFPGAKLVADSVTANGTFEVDVTTTSDSIAVAGMQPNSADWKREYVRTTNLEDPQCRMPDVGGNNNGYINLADFDVYPAYGGSGEDAYVIEFSEFYGNNPEPYALYNNLAYAGATSLNVYTMGMATLDTQEVIWPYHMELPYGFIPDQIFGVFWRAGFYGEATLGSELNVSSDDEDNSGISIAGTSDFIIVEWDNARSEVKDWEDGEEVTLTPHDDSYDFELLLYKDVGYGNNEYEFIMAYDNIEWGSSDGAGSIGLQGYYGPHNGFLPVNGYLGQSYAYNDLNEKVQDDLIICYDYKGPESSQYQLKFQIQVGNDASGNDLGVNVNHVVAGLADSASAEIVAVPSSIKLGGFSAKQIDEDTSLTGLIINYADENGGANTITVSGDNITATVHGHEAGSLVDITPAENFNGTTTVTVTVTDNVYAGDVTSTSFELTVVPVNDAPSVVITAPAQTIVGKSLTLSAAKSRDADEDSMTYQWSGPGTIVSPNEVRTVVNNLTKGRHTFTLTVSDGSLTTSESVTVEVRGKSGGSLSVLWMLLLTPVLAMRMRRRSA